MLITATFKVLTVVSVHFNSYFWCSIVVFSLFSVRFCGFLTVPPPLPPSCPPLKARSTCCLCPSVNETGTMFNLLFDTGIDLKVKVRTPWVSLLSKLTFKKLCWSGIIVIKLILVILHRFHVFVGSVPSKELRTGLHRNIRLAFPHLLTETKKSDQEVN